jgi:hypothetical protein
MQMPRERRNVVYFLRDSLSIRKVSNPVNKRLKNSSAFNLIQVRKTSTTLMNLREKIQKMDTINPTYTPLLEVLLEIAAS